MFSSRLATWLVSVCSGVVAAVSLLALTGCGALRGAKVDHPVLGPPPPRLTSVSSADPVMTAQARQEQSGEGSGLVQVSASDSDLTLPGYAVLATINGEPILANEMLAGVEGVLDHQRELGMPESRIEVLRRQFIKKHIEQKINETLLAQKLKLTLSPEQSEKLNEKLDEGFEKFLQKMMDGYNISSRVELERFLAKRGESLANYKPHFRVIQLANAYQQEQQILGLKKKVFGRPEIVAFYQEHQDKFAYEAKAKFQLLEVDFAKNGGQESARKRSEEALAQFKAGTPFPAVVKEYSDGPQAAEGGQWDWLKPGEFANNDVNTALFSVPVGQASDIIATNDSYIVVRVTDRKEAGVAPLSDVQRTIHTLLQKRYYQKVHEQILTDLRNDAVIVIHADFLKSKEDDNPLSMQSRIGS